jgi:gamma-glutamyltranspeptidase/glutathione hydrolase
LNDSRKGTIVAAHGGAVDAGVQILAQGGSAVDAAVTVATVLGVLDPANCGIGGYGGCMVVHQAGLQEASQIDFNTIVPESFDPDAFLKAGRTGRFVHGGPSVSYPAVMAGLGAAHNRFGRMPFSDLVRPAIRLAKNGFEVENDLQTNLSWAAARHRGLSDEFKSIFFRDGVPLKAGDRLIQPQLAESLEIVAQHGGGALRDGPLAEAICACVNGAGGILSPSDFARERIAVAPAERVAFRSAVVHGTSGPSSGFGILHSALETLSEAELGVNRGMRYIEQLFGSLRHAWNARHRCAQNLVAGARHTSHFCVSDADGMLVSLTFTHGPVWFGSGLVAPSTGIVLNAGANLFARSLVDNTIFPMTNLAPVILAGAEGTRHALGSPGGVRIPAIVLQMILDVAAYDLRLTDAIALPRVSVNTDGALEVEPALLSIIPSTAGAETINTRDYYGPASALSVSADGCAVAARDPRFTSAVAQVKDASFLPVGGTPMKEIME